MLTTVAICSGVLCAGLGNGQTMIFLFTYKSASAACGPLTSRPAIGCARTNCVMRSPNTASASLYTDCLVLPASVMMVCADKCGSKSRKTFCVCPTGMASTMTSADCTAWTYSGVFGWTKRSISPSSSACCITSMRRPTPMTFCATPAFFNAKVSEPPIRPAPMSRRLRIGVCGSCSYSFITSAQ